MTLDNHECDRDQNGDDHPYCYWKCDRQIGPQIDEQHEPDGGVGELSEEFESEVDDRARRGDRARYARQGHRAGAEDSPTHLR